jgi:uncharacterized protein (DUF111 family)
MEQEIVVLECNIDDMTGEALGYALEQMLAAGALDAWFTPIYMKKNRPAVILSVLCRPQDAEALRRLLLKETRTLGVRWRTMQREAAERRAVTVQTPWGMVGCKLKILDGRVVDAKPEYEDCAALARQHGLALEAVTLAAREAASAWIEP